MSNNSISSSQLWEVAMPSSLTLHSLPVLCSGVFMAILGRESFAAASLSLLLLIAGVAFVVIGIRERNRKVAAMMSDICLGAPENLSNAFSGYTSRWITSQTVIEMLGTAVMFLGGISILIGLI